MKSPWRIRALMVVGTLGAIVVHGVGPAAATVSEESCFVSAINSARSAAGVAPLSVNGDLLSIARSWSATMASAGHIYHNTNLANVAPSNWIALGENVGMGPDCDSIAQAFMNSPEHKRNILDPDFSTVGVGVVDAPDGTVYVTEDFMGVAAPAPAPAPKPAATTPAPAPVVTAAPKPAAAPAPAPAPAKAAAPAAAPKAVPATTPAAPVSPPSPEPTPAQPIVEEQAAETLSVQGVTAGQDAAEPAPAPPAASRPKPESKSFVQSVVSAIGSFFSHLF